ncbi:MAG: hypothetical protein SFW67_35580 [Myxococcaceae bacterium]|nr:hypothetical protein [Myxococcaceae bacterium]
MAEGQATAPSAGQTTPATPTQAPPAGSPPSTKPKQPAQAQAPAEPAQPEGQPAGEADDFDEAAWEAALAKAAAKKNLRLRHKGKDIPIKTQADLERALDFAQRGYGAAQLVEEAKAREAKAAEAQQRAAQLEQVLEAARNGDRQAYDMLFGENAPAVAAARARAAQEERERFEAMTESERALHAQLQESRQQAQQMRQMVEELRQQQAQLLQRQQQAQQEAEYNGALQEAQSYAQQVVEGLALHGVPPTVALPAVAQAMEDADALRERFGDIPPAVLVRRAMDTVKESTAQTLSALGPGALPLVKEWLAGLPAEAVAAALGPEKVRQLAGLQLRSAPAPTAKPAAPAPSPAPVAPLAGWGRWTR